MAVAKSASAKGASAKGASAKGASEALLAKVASLAGMWIRLTILGIAKGASWNHTHSLPLQDTFSKGHMVVECTWTGASHGRLASVSFNGKVQPNTEKLQQVVAKLTGDSTLVGRTPTWKFTAAQKKAGKDMVSMLDTEKLAQHYTSLVAT